MAMMPATPQATAAAKAKLPTAHRVTHEAESHTKQNHTRNRVKYETQNPVTGPGGDTQNTEYNQRPRRRHTKHIIKPQTQAATHETQSPVTDPDGNTRHTESCHRATHGPEWRHTDSHDNTHSLKRGAITSTQIGKHTPCEIIATITLEQGSGSRKGISLPYAY